MTYFQKLSWIAASIALALAGHAAEFRVIALSQIESQTRLEFRSADGIESIPVSTTGFSKHFEIPKSGEVSLFDKVPVAGEEKMPMLQLTFPKAGEDYIVVLKANGDARYHYILIEDDDGDFPAGSVLVMNFTKKAIYAKFGDERIQVDSGDRSVVSLAKQLDVPFNDGVKFAAEFDGYGKVFSSSSWYLLPTMKIFCVVFPDEHGNPRIRRIRLT